MKVLYQADNDLRKAIVRGAVRREPLKMSNAGAMMPGKAIAVPAGLD